MADIFKGSPSVYPEGSFYADLDRRIIALESVLGTAPGVIPDNAITRYKLGDQSVITAKVADKAVTWGKLADDVTLAPAFVQKVGAPRVEASGTDPAIALVDMDGGQDRKNWDIVANDKTLTYRALDDAKVTSWPWLKVLRPNDKTVTNIDFTPQSNTGLTVNGNQVFNAGAPQMFSPRQPKTLGAGGVGVSYGGTAFISLDGHVRTCGYSAAWGGDAGNYKYAFSAVRFWPGYAAPVMPFVKIARSGRGLFALDSAGRVFSAGYNTTGVLGHGDVIDRRVLQRIEWFVNNGVTVTDIVTIANTTSGPQGVGEDFVFFIGNVGTTVGAVWACGTNQSGLVGNGSAVGSTVFSAPTRVANLLNIKKLMVAGPGCASLASAMALDTSGQLWGWGYNATGCLGLGNTTIQTAPSITLTGVVDFAIAGGAYNTGYTYTALAIMADGTIRGTGSNAAGQMGDGTTVSQTSWKAAASGAPTNAAKVFLNGAGSTGWAFVICTDGTIKCVGANSEGQLGIGNTTSTATWQSPSALAGRTFTTALLVFSAWGTNSATHAANTLLIESDGTLWGAGDDLNGVLGTAVAQTTFAIIPLPEPVAEISLGASSSQNAPATFVRTVNNKLFVTGYNGHYNLGLYHNNSIDGFQEVPL